MNVDRNKCVGCGNCAIKCPQNCIEMCEDSEGFLYPKVNLDECIHCGLCDSICPVKEKLVVPSTVIAYAVKNRNDYVRNNSSSGGVFPAVAEYVIRNGGYVCGAVFNDSFDVQHIITQNLDDVKEMQGAKYSQSQVYQCFESIKNLLKHNIYVLFTGTPCQVQALKLYLGQVTETLITVDMICHGVPSPKVWREYLNGRAAIDANGSSVSSVNMRNKSSGWSKYNYSVEICYSNGAKYKELQGKDPFMKNFVNNLFLRKSCSCCEFKGISRSSDITLGDYWGVWNQYPEFDDNKGVSLILIHTQMGEQIWKQIEEDFDSIHVQPEEAIKENGSVVNQSKEHCHREVFFRRLNENVGIMNLLSQIDLGENSRNESLMSRFRKFLSNKYGGV